MEEICERKNKLLQLGAKLEELQQQIKEKDAIIEEKAQLLEFREQQLAQSVPNLHLLLNWQTFIQYQVNTFGSFAAQP